MVFESIITDPVRPDESIDEQLGVLFWNQLDLYAQRTLFVDHPNGQQLTGSQIKQQAAQVASYLKNVVKLPAESHCVIMYQNCATAHCIVLGFLFAGGSTSSWEPAESKAGKMHLINCLEPELVFCDAQRLSQCIEMQSEAAKKFSICVIDDDEQTFDKLTDEQRKFVFGYQRDILNYKPQDLHELPVKVSPDHAAFVLMTSGSTGLPKLVSRTHRNVVHGCVRSIRLQPQSQESEQKVWPGFQRFEHYSGLYLLISSLSLGLKLIIMEGYQMERLLEIIGSYKITDLVLITPSFQQLINACLAPGSDLLTRYDLSSVQTISYGGGKFIDIKSLERFEARMGDNLVTLQCYGITEGGLVALESKDKENRVPGTSGVLLPSYQLKLVDPDSGDEITEFDRQGEIYVRGVQVSPGYLGRGFEEQQRAAFLPDGFYRTGDLGSMSASQHLTVYGRIKETISLEGLWKALPSEFESIVMEMKEVDEVAVVGVPHKELPGRHKPRAYVVLRPESRGLVTESDVIQFVASKAWEAKQLTGGVRLVTELPHLPTGKIDKMALKRMDGIH